MLIRMPDHERLRMSLKGCHTMNINGEDFVKKPEAYTGFIDILNSCMVQIDVEKLAERCFEIAESAVWHSEESSGMGDEAEKLFAAAIREAIGEGE